MKPAILLASPTIRRRLQARRAVRVLRSLPADGLSPVDRAFLGLALEIFSKDEKGRTLSCSER